MLLQGENGVSRKGPRREQTSRYYSEPQLAVRGTLSIEGRRADVSGRAWLDHEWSDAYLDPGAAGWDWIGMNLDDGSALMAFRIRRADGSTLWSGGSHRPAGGATRDFANGEVVFVPGRIWTSPASSTRYPVEWQVATPAGTFGVRALLDDQELDSRNSTGAIYWEGLSLLVDARRRAGRARLSRDDRLRRPPRALGTFARCAPRAVGCGLGARRAQCAPAASTATFFAGRVDQIRTIKARKSMPERKNRSSTASVNACWSIMRLTVAIAWPGS